MGSLTLLKFPPKKKEPVETASKSITSVLNFVKKDVKDLAAIVVVAVTNDNAVYTLSNGLTDGDTVLALERAKVWFVENTGRKSQ